jgi:undecaprenyl-diphosphatase
MSDSFVRYLNLQQSRLRILSLCTAALQLLVLFSPAFSQPDPSNLDVRLFRSINNSQSQFKSSLLGVTDNSVWPIAVATPISLTIYGLLSDRDETFESGVLLGCTEVLEYSVSSLLKVGVRRGRPYKALAHVNTGHLDSADPYSFPSGHTAGAFAIATMLALRYSKNPEVYIPAFVWAGLVGYGRIYFGLHYPSDVLGGALVGAGSSLLVYKYKDEILPMAYKLLGKKEPRNVSAIVLPYGGGTFVNVAVKF